ncbi:hypothetical protein EV421DRAFT_1737221 [Armillaria borealis]|uniref:Uncharacterized protein n=1 Tax=Armillaria borealis TaxID=47425 RepID=A0AA39MP32_9AGAR|nr:hypothetical protein EV421DRAFT_1737221 [Armillaria borealis]
MALAVVVKNYAINAFMSPGTLVVKKRVLTIIALILVKNMSACWTTVVIFRQMSLNESLPSHYPCGLWTVPLLFITPVDEEVRVFMPWETSMLANLLSSDGDPSNILEQLLGIKSPVIMSVDLAAKFIRAIPALNVK